MTTADDDRRAQAGEADDGLPYLPPPDSGQRSPVPPLAATPPGTPIGIPELPPRPEGAPVAARLGPPPNAPLSASGADATGDEITSGHPEPDPEVIAALQGSAARLRRRNRAFQAVLAAATIVAVAAGAYFGYRAYDREQEERQPPTTERPTSQELLDELDDGN